MPKYLLRVDGINQSHFLFDCQELSTVRGGGLLLLQAVRDIRKFVPGLTVVSAGASVGLFEFAAADQVAADEIGQKTKQFLTEHKEYCHATFAVDIVLVSDDFPKDLERVTAKNRRRQWCEPSLSMTDLGGKSASEACEVDLVRPAVILKEIAGVSKGVSSSVVVRHEHGRQNKQLLYEKETGIRDLRYVSTLEDLTMKFPVGSSIPGHLYGKMAVIYVDGNGFGKLQDRLCTTADRLKTWDVWLQTIRRQLLRKLVEKASNNPAWLCHDKIRLETLLWGGDELIWVVPAWKAFEVLELISSESRGWKIPKSLDDSQPAVTHAVGVVICSHKAPIHRMTGMADDLAGLAKDKSREANLVAIETLESFDHIGSDLIAYRAGNTPKRKDNEPDKERAKRTVLPLDHIDAVRRHVVTLKNSADDFPRRKHHELVQALLREGAGGPTVNKLGNDLTARLPESAKEAWKALSTLLGGDDTAWVLLWQLWDYVTGEQR